MCEVSADFEVKTELDTRFHQLKTRLNTVTAENEEVVSSDGSDISHIITITEVSYLEFHVQTHGNLPISYFCASDS